MNITKANQFLVDTFIKVCKDTGLDIYTNSPDLEDAEHHILTSTDTELNNNELIKLTRNYLFNTPVLKASDLIISLDEQQTILDLLHHHRRTTDVNKDVYAHNKHALLVRLNNNKIDNK